MQIRRVQQPDLPTLAALARQTYADAYGHEMPPAGLSRHVQMQLSDERMGQMFRQDVFLLAEVEDKPVGFVQLGAARPEYRSEDGQLIVAPGDQEIRRLYVMASGQGRGLGGRLMNAALEAVPHARRVFLTVWHTNLGAQRFYARFGFVQIGTVPFPASKDGFDLLLCRAVL